MTPEQEAKLGVLLEDFGLEMANSGACENTYTALTRKAVIDYVRSLLPVQVTTKREVVVDRVVDSLLGSEEPIHKMGFAGFGIPRHQDQKPRPEKK